MRGKPDSKRHQSHAGVAGLDIDKAALFGNHVQQCAPSVAIYLAHNAKSLIA